MLLTQAWINCKTKLLFLISPNPFYMHSGLRLLFIFSLLSCDITYAHLPEPDRVMVPLGGNTWVQGGQQEKVTNEGLLNWTTPEALVTTYVHFAGKARFKLYLRAMISATSKVEVTVGEDTRTFALTENEKGEYYLGDWWVEAAGYHTFKLRGVTKSATSFGTPTAWILEGDELDRNTSFVRNNEDNYFYWGRRGPSVHLNYPTPPNTEVEWFYNEVTVPVGQDVIGTYFMANGFAEGYFGMQVNSESERRILFSVWSPFKTDDPKAIPEEQRIKMLRKGKDVYTGEFGNEGAGGQSYLKYNWKAGNTYRFLLHGKPSEDSTTTYTAYFYAPEEGKWRIIASFKRPVTTTYLARLHSFLENFIPTTGNTSRRVYFGNQWVKARTGNWTEITECKFTADATARKGYRLDFMGGVEKGQFYLQNCGFFDGTTEIGMPFQRQSKGIEPQIPWGKLP